MRPLILHRAFPEHIARVLAERAAQGIAARSDKTRSGLAAGKSPTRRDAPNSLTQRNIQS
jgi:hypothetical protein